MPLLPNKITQQFSWIEGKLSEYKKKNKRIFVSSSFQTHSIPLLHILSQIDNEIPIFFLNTGFHFPETLTFKEDIGKLLGIQIFDVESPIVKINQRDQEGRFFFCSNSDYCCHINKVLPLEPILMKYDVWITGVRRDQNNNRKQMDYEAKGPHNTVRFHPMLDWTSKMIWEYRKVFNLPSHPLEAQGYLSIGCQPCTQKFIGDERSGRWKGQNKNECGLHTDLIK